MKGHAVARERFGEVAVRLGYVTEEQVHRALDHQRDLHAKNDHRLIGLVMLDLGIITNIQLVNVLKEMQNRAD